MCLCVEMPEDHPMGVEDNGGIKPLATPTMELEAVDDTITKSNKRKRNSNPMPTNDDCCATKLDRFYKRVILSLTKPSYLLGLGFNFVRPENRQRLFRLLQKLVRRHDWVEAAGVLSVLLKGTRKDNCPALNRFKYSVLMGILEHIESDDVDVSVIVGIYETWMTRIGTNMSNKRNRDGHMKEDSIVVHLQFILSRFMQGDIESERHNAKVLMREHGYSSHPMFNMIIGLISCQLWYSSITEEMQWRDTIQIHTPTYSDISATPSQSKMSATRFSYESGNSGGHNAIFDEDISASFKCDSETSVMKDKDIYVEADGVFNSELVPVGVEDDLHKENPSQDFQPQNFYLKSAESNDSFDDSGRMHFVPDLSAFGTLDSWMLPLRTEHWELEKVVHDEEYKNAVKYLQEAVCSTSPVLPALLPLIQLLLMGCRDKEALNELEKFCAISKAALPNRLKANLLERVDPNNSVMLSTCFEDALKSDPKCSQSLARLFSLHQKGYYSPESLLEVIALHLDAVSAEYNIWREFALCFLKVFRYGEDQMSSCLHGNEGGQRQHYSVCYNRVPKLFIHGTSGRAWRSRCRWWSTRHFSRSVLASEISAGDLQLLAYKAACASHMYGQYSEYVVKVYSILQSENNMDLLKFLQLHIRNSIGLHLQFQRRTT